MSQYRAIEKVSRPSSQELRTESDCGHLALLRRRYSRAHKCVASRAALLILMWVFLANFTFWLTSSGFATIIKKVNLTSSENINFYFLNASTLSYIFYPLAGYLADIKFGRFKTILQGTYALILFLIIFSITSHLILYLSLENLPKVVVYLLTIALCASCLLVIIAFATINANFIQFGIDQLHDSPEGCQSLFIYWYIWIINFTLFLSQATQYILLVYTKPKYFFLMFLPLITLLIVSVLLIKRQKVNFFIDNTRYNPYNLVYAVTKFARKHKVPIRRSAFTYCEDNVPSGLDLGKDKYSGPFSTEQVEDVKAFYGILKFLLAIGPVCALNDIKRLYSFRNDLYFGFSSIPYLLVVITIPIYISLIRPFIYYYLPGMLKRIGLGVMANLSYLLLRLLVLEAAVHVSQAEVQCPFAMVVYYTNATSGYCLYDYFMVFPKIFHFLSILLFNISLYEFICSQSPNCMKGLLIGLSFAISGTLQTLLYGILAIASQVHIPYLTCGTFYFIVCIFLALVGFLAYLRFARKYQFRKRDELCPIYQYAENYYSKKDTSKMND